MKTILWGFCGQYGHSIIQQLETELDIYCYFSNQDSSYDIWEFILGRHQKIRPTKQAIEAYNDFFYEHFSSFQILVARRDFSYKHRPLHDLINEFNNQFYFFHNLLARSGTELIIFSNMPHEGPDFILYQLAKKLEVKILICYQTIFPNKFLLSTSNEGLCTLRTTPKVFDQEIPEFEKSFAQPLFYMDEIFERQEIRKNGGIKKLILSIRAFTENSVTFLQQTPSRLQKIFNNPWNMISAYTDKKLSLLEYRSNINAYTINTEKLKTLFSKSKKTIYFPLHMQPELTTSAQGGIYQDQLFALESLRSDLDDSWTILVKENPLQSSFQRENSFFQRLSCLENVLLVSNDVPSQYLIKHTEATASITGTAGWEAMKGGKKAIFFGLVWYANFRNAYYYPSQKAPQQLEKFLQQETLFSELKEDFSEAMARIALGVVDPDYNTLVNNYNREKNAQLVTQSIMIVVKHPETIWC